MNILTLDIATVTGWAFIGQGMIRPEAGTFRAAPPKAPKDQLGVFMAGYKSNLIFVITLHKPHQIVFEAPFLGVGISPLTARKLYGLQAITELIAHELDIPIRQATVGEIRKHFLGSGKHKRAEAKQRVMQECLNRGWDPKNQDEADAMALLSYAAFCLGSSYHVGRPGGKMI